MADINFDKVISSYLYNAYNYSGPAEIKEKTAAAIKDLVVAKVIYEKWENQKKVLKNT